MQTIKYHLLVLTVPGLLFLGCEKKSAPQPSAVASAKPTSTSSKTGSAETKTSPEGDKKETNSAANDGERSKKEAADIKKVAAPTEPSTPETASSPSVAIVNGEKIPDVRFQAELDKRTAHGGEIPEDRLLRIKQTILRRIVDETLIQQAVDAAKITIPDAKLEESMAEYKGRFESEERFKNYLRHSKISLEDIKKQRLKRLKVEYSCFNGGHLR